MINFSSSKHYVKIFLLGNAACFPEQICESWKKRGDFLGESIQTHDFSRCLSEFFCPQRALLLKWGGGAFLKKMTIFCQKKFTSLKRPQRPYYFPNSKKGGRLPDGQRQLILQHIQIHHSIFLLLSLFQLALCKVVIVYVNIITIWIN